MRAIWKGHVSFALVSIPVSVYSASRTSDISLKYLHKKDLSPVSYRRFCDREDVEVGWEEITRGYEFEKGRFVEITGDELREASRKLSRTIQIMEFVEVSEIDPVYFDKPYYLEPQVGGEHAYSLLTDAMARSGKAGVARVVIKTREHLAVVRPFGRLMTMQTLRFAHEIVEPNQIDLPAATTPSEKEVELAHTLVETMTSTFDASHYRDEYRSEVLEVIRRKVAGEVPAQTTEPGPAHPGRVTDLMEVLRESLKNHPKREPSPAAREKTVVVSSRARRRTKARSPKGR